MADRREPTHDRTLRDGRGWAAGLGGDGAVLAMMLAMIERRPGEGRYARVEREQRWVAAGLPGNARRIAVVEDRYVSGTRLRLRRAETGGEVVFKLGQKVRVDPADPEVVKLTNLYLSSEEHAVLAVLPAAEIRKTRWHVRWNGRTVAVDEFHGRHRGILLAEVELASDELLLAQPDFALRDITHDERFTGGALAVASDATIAELLREIGVHGTPT